MKKIFFVIIACILLISCDKEGPQGRSGRDGRDGRDGIEGVQITTIYHKVYPNEWNVAGTYGNQGYYCYSEVFIKEITEDVINYGAVLVYVIFDDFDNQLPYLQHLSDNGYLWTRVIRYDLQPGIIGFIVEDSDFLMQLPPFKNDVIQFKVVIIS